MLSATEGWSRGKGGWEMSSLRGRGRAGSIVAIEAWCYERGGRVRRGCDGELSEVS